jgi:serine/threonine-protein kinase
MDQYFKINEKVNGYSILKLLGEGRYGIVYLAVNDNKEHCVIKQLKNELLNHTRNKLFYEEQILSNLSNPGFPKYIAPFKEDSREGYLMEYIPGKVFEDLLMDHYVFSKQEIYKIGSRLLELIEVLHNHNIIHRDIRVPNVILKDDNRLALIDFGLARFLDNDKHVKQLDYWFFGDFLIHLLYSTYKESDKLERPWFEELELNTEEIIFLSKLMGIEESYENSTEIKHQLEKIMKSI